MSKVLVFEALRGAMRPTLIEDCQFSPALPLNLCIADDPPLTRQPQNADVPLWTC
jgi:hypothetical protein